jgi:hypothetical protein
MTVRAKKYSRQRNDSDDNGIRVNAIKIKERYGCLRN